MNLSQKYSLSITGAFFLTLIAQALLLAPRTQSDLFSAISAGKVLLLGGVFYFISLVLFGSILLGYKRPAQTWINLLAAAAFVVIGSEFIRSGYMTEGATILVWALAFLLSTWVFLEQGWLVETMRWVNLIIGAGLLLRPDLFIILPGYAFFSTFTRMVVGIGFLLTSLLSLSFDVFRWQTGQKLGRILALPWAVWGLVTVMPLNLPGFSLVLSVVLGLTLCELLPWDKLVLVQAVDLGRRFVRLMAAGQFIFLSLAVWIIYRVESSPWMPAQTNLEIHAAILVAYNLFTVVGILAIVSANLSINGLFAGLYGKASTSHKDTPRPTGLWGRLVLKFLVPFTHSQNLLHDYVSVRKEHEALRGHQLLFEKRRMAQLNLLHQLNLELESVLDPSTSAQLTANAIINSLGGALVAVLRYDQENEELVVIATSGPHSSSVPPGYRQKMSQGLIGRAARLCRTQFAPDTRLDPDYLGLEKQNTLSEMAVPLLQHHRLKGVVMFDSQDANNFDVTDIRTIEAAAIQLVTSWERSDQEERLTNLIGAGVALSTTLEMEDVIKEITAIAQTTLGARFVFVTLSDESGAEIRTAHAGSAPTLLSILDSDPGNNPLIQDVINSAAAFRMRDVRKRYKSMLTGSQDLRSMLAVPIRVRKSSIGAILSFGKLGYLSFSENDESLVSLLATQAAAAIESTWLYQKLRSMLATATQLYALSIRIIQSDQLVDAAAAIVETAYQLSYADSAGIVLIGADKKIETMVQIDADGLHPGAQHPMELVNQVLETGKTIITSNENLVMQICLPLQTSRGLYGALWLNAPEKYLAKPRYTENLHTLANQAALALDRSLLIMQTRKQAVEIESAYRELEITYDQTLGALSSALDARDRETEGHSLRVARIAYHLGLRLGLNPEQVKTLERGSILHDIGKIGISDSVLLKPGKLSETEWQLMRQHPDIGARIIEGIPFLQDTLPVIRYHQERWDGSGYPAGLKEHEIPLMARIFAIVDAFDALTNDRPYRKHGTVSDAVLFLRENAGLLFDPVIVSEFEAMVQAGELASLV